MVLQRPCQDIKLILYPQIKKKTAGDRNIRTEIFDPHEKFTTAFPY